MKKIFLLCLMVPLMITAQEFGLKDTVFKVGMIYRPTITFDFDKPSISVTSQKTLDSLATFLTINRALVLEVGNHRDSRADNSYSMNLTARRAQSVVDYLVSKGIDPQRLLAKGYGSSKPLVSDAEINKLKNKEDIEKAHQKNRRTEFIILSIGYLGMCLPMKDTLDGMPVYSTAFKAPEFPGGTHEQMNYVRKSLTYPKDQKEIQTRVYLTFIVDTAGKVRNACIFKTFYKTETSLLEKAVIKIYEEMPKWTPAEDEKENNLMFRISVPIRIEVK